MEIRNLKLFFRYKFLQFKFPILFVARFFDVYFLKKPGMQGLDRIYWPNGAVSRLAFSKTSKVASQFLKFENRAGLLE